MRIKNGIYEGYNRKIHRCLRRQFHFQKLLHDVKQKKSMKPFGVLSLGSLFEPLMNRGITFSFVTPALQRGQV